MTAKDDAKGGTLTAMLEGYDRSVLNDLPGLDGERRLSSLMDFNAGATGALQLVAARLKAGECSWQLVDRLLKEAESIHERLNPELFRRKP